MLLDAAQGGDPQNFRLSPWLFTPSLSVAFPTKEWPLEYFSRGERTGLHWRGRTGSGCQTGIW